MDKLEKLGYKKYDNHPNTEDIGWTTQDERQIIYTDIDKAGNKETIVFEPRNDLIWVSATKCDKGHRFRIPAPLNFEELEAIYKIAKKYHNNYLQD